MEYVLAPLRAVWMVLRMIGAVLGLGSATVHRSLRTLQWHRSARWTFRRRARPIDAVWLTGEGVLRALAGRKHGIRRLILPHPGSHALVDFEEATGQPYGLPTRIIQMTKLALDLDIEVGWYPELVHVFFTVGKHWVHVEPHPPSTGDSEAPVYRLGILNFRTRAFYRRAFDEMWGRCPKDGDSDKPYIDSAILEADPATLAGLINGYRAQVADEISEPLPLPPAGIGVGVTDSKDVRIEGSHFEGLGEAVVARGVDDLELIDNTVIGRQKPEA